jgi:hypothetical protein
VESVPLSEWHAANGERSRRLKALLSPREQLSAPFDRLASKQEAGKTREQVPLFGGVVRTRGLQLSRAYIERLVNSIDHSVW